MDQRVLQARVASARTVRRGVKVGEFGAGGERLQEGRPARLALLMKESTALGGFHLGCSSIARVRQRRRGMRRGGADMTP